jgi:hypothetical protein
MKAPIAQVGVKVASSPGCAFCLRPRNIKLHLKKLGFRLGPDLAILCTEATGEGGLDPSKISGVGTNLAECVTDVPIGCILNR